MANFSQHHAVVKLDKHGNTAVIAEFGELSEDDCMRLARTLNNVRRYSEHFGYLYDYLVVNVEGYDIGEAKAQLSQVAQLANC